MDSFCLHKRFDDDWLQDRVGEEELRYAKTGCARNLMHVAEESRSWVKRAMLCRGIWTSLQEASKDPSLKDHTKGVPEFLRDLAEIHPNRNYNLPKYLAQRAGKFGPLYDLVHYVRAAREHELFGWDNPCDEKKARLQLGDSPGAKLLPSLLVTGDEVNPEFYSDSDELRRVSVREERILIAFGLAARVQAITLDPFSGLERLGLIENIEIGLRPILDGLTATMPRELGETFMVHYLRQCREMRFPPVVKDRLVEMTLLCQLILDRPELLGMTEPRFSAAGGHNDFPGSRGGRSSVGKGVGSGHNH